MKFRAVIPKPTSERETTIVVSDWEEGATVFSSHPYVLKKLEKIVKENSTARELHTNKDDSKLFSIDKRHFSINPRAHSPRKDK